MQLELWGKCGMTPNKIIDKITETSVLPQFNN